MQAHVGSKVVTSPLFFFFLHIWLANIYFGRKGPRLLANFSSPFGGDDEQGGRRVRNELLLCEEIPVTVDAQFLKNKIQSVRPAQSNTAQPRIFIWNPSKLSYKHVCVTNYTLKSRHHCPVYRVPFLCKVWKIVERILVNGLQSPKASQQLTSAGTYWSTAVATVAQQIQMRTNTDSIKVVVKIQPGSQGFLRSKCFNLLSAVWKNKDSLSFFCPINWYRNLQFSLSLWVLLSCLTKRSNSNVAI